MGGGGQGEREEGEKEVMSHQVQREKKLKNYGYHTTIRNEGY